MFQKEIDKLYNNICNIFGIADDIIITRFDEDGRNHDVRLKQVL